MDTLDFDYFLKQLEIGANIGETNFYFSDDAANMSRWLGFTKGFEKPYWVGYCDIPDGTEFQTAEELVNARIYDGKSLKERWEKVRIFSIDGVDLNIWLSYFK